MKRFFAKLAALFRRKQARPCYNCGNTPIEARYYIVIEGRANYSCRYECRHCGRKTDTKESTQEALRAWNELNY